MGTEPSHQHLNAYIHPRLGNITRIQLEEGDEGIQYVVRAENQSTFQKWENQLDKLDNSVCDQLLFLPLSYQVKRVSLCGSTTMVYLEYQSYMFTLSSEIKNRFQIQRPFQEKQIWYILYILIKLQAIFQSFGQKIGNIQPQNILLNQEADIKIISQYSWPTTPQSHSQISFLAPQECKRKFQKKNSKIDKNKAQIFSIGITLLQACTLRNCGQLYGFSYIFNETLLQEYLQIVEGRYSATLNKFLREMLRISPAARKTAEELEKPLIPYDEKLMSLSELTSSEKQLIQEELLTTPKSQSLMEPVSHETFMEQKYSLIEDSFGERSTKIVLSTVRKN